MIFICCIKYGGKAGICVLVVGNDELDMGGNVAASLEVAKGGTRAGRLGEVTWMDLMTEQNAWGTGP
jgi:hypothetical protein